MADGMTSLERKRRRRRRALLAEPGFAATDALLGATLGRDPLSILISFAATLLAPFLLPLPLFAIQRTAVVAVGWSMASRGRFRCPRAPVHPR